MRIRWSVRTVSRLLATLLTLALIDTAGVGATTSHGASAAAPKSMGAPSGLVAPFAGSLRVRVDERNPNAVYQTRFGVEQPVHREICNPCRGNPNSEFGEAGVVNTNDRIVFYLEVINTGQRFLSTDSAHATLTTNYVNAAPDPKDQIASWYLDWEDGVDQIPDLLTQVWIRPTSPAPCSNEQPNSYGWKDRTISYRFMNGTFDIARSDEHESVRRAFGTWETALSFLEEPFHFREVSSGTAQIEIEWTIFGDDTPERVVAVGAGIWTTQGYPVATEGKLEFYEEEAWTTQPSTMPGGPIDLYLIALHEIGHVLGLGHVNLPGALMYCSPNRRALSGWEIQAAKCLYARFATEAHCPRELRSYWLAKQNR